MLHITAATYCAIFSPAQCNGQAAVVAVYPEEVNHPLEAKADWEGHLLQWQGQDDDLHAD